MGSNQGASEQDGTFIRQKRLTSELNTFQCLQAPDAKAGAALRGPGQIDSVDLHLEHNTLVIMWPPCQEEWRHEVCCAGSHHIVYWSDAMLVRVTYPAMHVGPLSCVLPGPYARKTARLLVVIKNVQTLV